MITKRMGKVCDRVTAFSILTAIASLYSSLTVSIRDSMPSHTCGDTRKAASLQRLINSLT
ncbi:MAG: hypothetical protein KME43_09425 [Myxacorys chilensis ATA2-1-KO14]|nr:hypothetical protein [Myxacorys chilensis ATA2-1-KO14]